MPGVGHCVMGSGHTLRTGDMMCVCYRSGWYRALRTGVDRYTVAV